MAIACKKNKSHIHVMNQSVYDRAPDVMRPENIGRRLQLVREAVGLSKSEMADLLGIERTYWSRFEGGKRAIPYDYAYLLFERFGVGLDFIILGRYDHLPLKMAEQIRKIERS